ncbi:MAG: phage major capsid protein [Bosea sp.]|uniref:phage major capsid protein n=1 Tax=Bosea sp. (in: a-proteobacteria) TaxID=1871050 RepID=UPI001AC7940D|nr:phage major capsid protein [Bosea sp. (in: a-proteobacteria)]MBN9468988.1 phage major capsid protein [Bosea sp. (in: a-proteobacteria)]
MTDLVATEIQRRHVAAPLARAVVDAEAGTFSGYAAVFNDLVPSYNERVLPGSFTRTLSERATRGDALAILWAHDPREVIGVATSLVEDSYGLKVEGRLILDIARARDAHTLIREGINSLSIGFYPVKWDRNAKGEYLIEDAELVEFSVVYAGASPRAKITSIRSLEVSMPNTNTDTAELETRVADLQSRIDELEVRDQRGGAGATADATADTERRALASFIRTGEDTEIRAASSDNDTAGGFFILPTVDSTIRNLLADVSPIRSLAEVVTIGGNTYERFYSTGNRGAQWVGEKSARPQDTARPELIKHSYGVAEMYAAPATTRHLAEDASFDVAGWFQTWVANDFALTEGDAFWNGDGIDGKPKGLLTYPIVADADATRAWGSTQYVPAGHASAPDDDTLAKALVKLVLTLHPRFRGNARMLVNSATYIRFRQLQDTAKRFLWAATGNLVEDAENGSILGYPVVIDDHLQDIGANNIIAAFGDFGQAYVVVDRHGLRVERDAVTTKGAILYDTYSRVGGGLGDSRAVKFLKVSAT